MNKLLATLALLTLTACSDSAKQMHFPAAPQELADCKFYYLTNSSGASMTVVRCPNSTTTTKTKHGKTYRITVLTDGTPTITEE